MHIHFSDARGPQTHLRRQDLLHLWGRGLVFLLLRLLASPPLSHNLQSKGKALSTDICDYRVYLTHTIFLRGSYPREITKESTNFFYSFNIN